MKPWQVFLFTISAMLGTFMAGMTVHSMMRPKPSYTVTITDVETGKVAGSLEVRGDTNLQINCERGKGL